MASPREAELLVTAMVLVMTGSLRLAFAAGFGVYGLRWFVAFRDRRALARACPFEAAHQRIRRSSRREVIDKLQVKVRSNPLAKATDHLVLLWLTASTEGCETAEVARAADGLLARIEELEPKHRLEAGRWLATLDGRERLSGWTHRFERCWEALDGEDRISLALVYAQVWMGARAFEAADLLLARAIDTLEAVAACEPLRPVRSPRWFCLREQWADVLTFRGALAEAWLAVEPMAATHPEVVAPYRFNAGFAYEACQTLLVLGRDDPEHWGVLAEMLETLGAKEAARAFFAAVDDAPGPFDVASAQGTLEHCFATYGDEHRFVCDALYCLALAEREAGDLAAAAASTERAIAVFERSSGDAPQLVKLLELDHELRSPGVDPRADPRIAEMRARYRLDALEALRP